MKKTVSSLKPATRETATATLLRILQTQTEVTADLFDTFCCSYYESYRRARGKMTGALPRVKFEGDWGDRYLAQQKFHKLLSKLKSEGLVKKQKKDQGTRWSLTLRGKKRLVPPPTLLSPSLSQVIVSYDIPKSHATERDWLRRTLQFLDFKLLHQSVWLGTGALTEAFLTELREREILDYVHIMEMGKGGTVS